MKLVEILARELEIWPDGVDKLTQSCVDAEIYANKGNPARDHVPLYPQIYASCRSDESICHEYPIITREMWEAERAKLKEGKTVKANKDGWIRHRGGKCPVEPGTLVDVRYRDGATQTAKSLDGTYAEVWQHSGHRRDIMAYRLHKPERQSAKVGKLEIEVTANTEGVREVIEEMQMQIDQIEGPLQWRDRIHEIDAASKDEEARHCAAMEAFDKERADLVAKLAAEGLALVERVEVAPAEDMSDWRNWRVGDLVKCVSAEVESCEVMCVGKLYRVDRDGGCLVIIDEEGDPMSAVVESSRIEWHSRPTA